MILQCSKSVTKHLSAFFLVSSLISAFIAVFIDAPPNTSKMILSRLGHFCILSSKPTKWHISHGLLRLLCFSVFHPRAAHFQQCDFLISLINFFDIYCVYSDFSVLCINQLIPVSFSSLVFVYWFWLGRRKPRGNIVSFFSSSKRIVPSEVFERSCWYNSSAPTMVLDG